MKKIQAKRSSLESVDLNFDEDFPEQDFLADMAAGLLDAELWTVILDFGGTRIDLMIFKRII